MGILSFKMFVCLFFNIIKAKGGAKYNISKNQYVLKTFEMSR